MLRLFLVVAALGLSLGLSLGLWTTLAADDATEIRLSAGHNVVTWNGAEPYALSEFEGTPVARIYRWDAVRQRWLSHVVGEAEPTLPELHLLPRVQYLLVAERDHALSVPDVLDGLDPFAALRYPPVPADPLRFEAWWPNEDSPLEDLVVLRGEDERLSVEAWVAGGEGEVEVYWSLDGRLNHQGAASDDVDLQPGGHDHGRLYAVDEAGQTIVQELPRVVRLPRLELPEMTYGLFTSLNEVGFTGTWVEQFVFNNGNWGAVEQSLDLIADAGFKVVTIPFWWSSIERESNQYNPHWLETFDRIVEEASNRGLDLMASVIHAPAWAAESLGYSGYPLGRVARDSADYAEIVAFVAERWPEIRYFYLVEEPDVSDHYRSMDPAKAAADTIAGALAAWYHNPDAVILGANLTGYVYVSSPIVVRDGQDWDVIAGVLPFLRALYSQPGFADHVDVISFHPWWCPLDDSPGDVTTAEAYVAGVERVRSVMLEHGDYESHLWASSVFASTASADRGGVSPKVQGECYVAIFDLLTELDYVTGVFQFRFTDDRSGETSSHRTGLVRITAADEIVPKPSYYALRNYLLAQAQRTDNREDAP